MQKAVELLENIRKWVLKEPKPCKPIPYKGSLGIWEYNGLYVE
jgi:hypothetical protein